eukprot:scaffold1509_cov240-Pinguiococcus_pyrenoidosus.AAC.22
MSSPPPPAFLIEHPGGSSSSSTASSTPNLDESTKRFALAASRQLSSSSTNPQVPPVVGEEKSEHSSGLPGKGGVKTRNLEYGAISSSKQVSSEMPEHEPADVSQVSGQQSPPSQSQMKMLVSGWSQKPSPVHDGSGHSAPPASGSMQKKLVEPQSG